MCSPELEPDRIEDTDVIIHILDTLDVDAACTFESVVDHVKGTPMYGTMMQMDGTQREQLMVKLRHVVHQESGKEPEKENEDLNRVIANLRKVHRPSLVGAPKK